MKNNKQECNVLRSRIDVLQGKIDLLEREIDNRKSNIPILKQDVRERKMKYKEVAAEYGRSRGVIIPHKNAGKIANALIFGTMKIGMPTDQEVVDRKNDWDNAKWLSENRIDGLEKEINSIGRDINRLQREKENLVSEMRHLGCYRR